MPPAPTPACASAPSKPASSLHLSIPKLPEPQRGTPKCLRAGNETIFNCEEAGYTLPLVTTHLQTMTALKSNQARKAAPELVLFVVETGFLLKPCNVLAVTITSNSHACYQFQWEASGNDQIA